MSSQPPTKKGPLCRPIAIHFPSKAISQGTREYDKDLYKQRNRIERCFSKLKCFADSPPRYEKSKNCFQANAIVQRLPESLFAKVPAPRVAWGPWAHFCYPDKAVLPIHAPRVCSILFASLELSIAADQVIGGTVVLQLGFFLAFELRNNCCASTLPSSTPH